MIRFLIFSILFITLSSCGGERKFNGKPLSSYICDRGEYFCQSQKMFNPAVDPWFFGMGGLYIDPEYDFSEDAFLNLNISQSMFIPGSQPYGEYTDPRFHFSTLGRLKSDSTIEWYNPFSESSFQSEMKCQDHTRPNQITDCKLIEITLEPENTNRLIPVPVKPYQPVLTTQPIHLTFEQLASFDAVLLDSNTGENTPIGEYRIILSSGSSTAGSWGDIKISSMLSLYLINTKRTRFKHSDLRTSNPVFFQSSVTGLSRPALSNMMIQIPIPKVTSIGEPILNAYFLSDHQFSFKAKSENKIPIKYVVATANGKSVRNAQILLNPIP